MNKHKINILGINIAKFRKTEVLQNIKQFLNDSNQRYLATINPEFILTAQKDEEFFYILNHADMGVPDGFGLKCATWAMGANIYRYPGADMAKDIFLLAQDNNLKVAVLNWQDGLANACDIEQALKSSYPKLLFSVKDIGREGLPVDFNSIIEYQPKILLVALGAPYQEKFIFHNLKKIPSVKLAIGIGGAMDFLTGRIRRAPKIIQVSGMEWLWRLIQQPWRWKRIYKAVVIFPVKFINWRFVLPFKYRKNVSCLLYKKINNKYYFLIVKRSEQPGHWQLPQGGLDKLDILEAGIKELHEEINTKNVKPVKHYPNLYKYKFGDREGESGYRAAISQKYTGYKGQMQSLLIVEFLGEDEEIKINYWDHSDWKWVDSQNLINEVHPIRKKATKIFLEKFNQVIKTYEEKN